MFSTRLILFILSYIPACITLGSPVLCPNFATMFAVYRRLIMSAACWLTHRALQQKNLNTDVNTNVFRQNTEFYWTKDVCICQTFVFAFTSDLRFMRLSPLYQPQQKRCTT